MMRSLLLLRPKPPAIKPPFALNRKGDRLGGKVTPSSHNGDPQSTAGQKKKKKAPCGAEKVTIAGERESDKSAARERRQRVIYVSSERSGNWE